MTHGVPNEPTFSAGTIVSKVTPVPLAAIHSTRDEFVPESEVRGLMGRASEPKRLWMVTASDHRFSGNVEEFDRTAAGIDRVGEAEPAAGVVTAVDRMRRAVPAVAALVLFLVALEVLRRELHAVTWQALSIGVLGIPRWLLASAVLLTALNYAVLTGYDFIALASIGRGNCRDCALRVAVTSFLAYAIANSVGFAMLSGASIRYRVYSRWGISGEQFSQVVISYSVTFWLGLLLLAAEPAQPADVASRG